MNYSKSVTALVNLNRVKEARATVAEAAAKKLDSPDIRFALYQLAFLQSDEAAMAEQVSWAAERPGDDSVLLYYQADTAAYYGQLNKARELSRQAVAAAERAGRKERAAGCEAAAGLREALFGNGAEAKRFAANALKHSNGRDVQFMAGLALAMVGDRDKAVELADALKSRYPGRHHRAIQLSADDLRTDCTGRPRSSASPGILEEGSPVRTGTGRQQHLLDVSLSCVYSRAGVSWRRTTAPLLRRNFRKY